ncbi:MAG TPA: TolC family protein [Oscillatoriaceae cyanobacterium]
MAVTAGAASAQTAPAQPVDMESLVGVALKQSPTLAASQQSAQAAAAKVTQARSAYFPQISLNGGATETNSLVANQTSSLPFGYLNGSVSAQQLVFNFGKTSAAVQVAEANAHASADQANVTAVDVAYGVRQAYLDWAQAYELQKTADEQVRIAQDLTNASQARLKAGVAANIDLTQAQATLAQAIATQISARTTTDESRRALATAMGSNAPITGTPAFPATAPIASSALANLEQQALKAHPSYAAAVAQAQAADASALEAERAGWPDVNLSGSYGTRVQQAGPAPNWQAGLNLSMPLFTGFNLTAQTQSAQANARAAHASADNERLQILLGVDQAYLALVGAREKVPASESSLKAARANLDQATGRYKAGVGSIIEVENAETLLANAESDLARTRAAYYLAIAQLQRAVGTTGVTP